MHQSINNYSWSKKSAQNHFWHPCIPQHFKPCKQCQWGFPRYSNIVCSGYPLGALDSILPDGSTNWWGSRWQHWSDHSVIIFLKTNLMAMTLCLYKENDGENNFSVVITVVLISTIRIVMTTIKFMSGGEKKEATNGAMRKISFDQLCQLAKILRKQLWLCSWQGKIRLP